MRYGHPCQRACGDCTWETVSKNGLIKLLENNEQFSRIERKEHNGKCLSACARAMPFCEHLCEGVCHEATECPPCNKICTSYCPHTKCGRTCSEPCPSCALPCVWTCPHGSGNCDLYCGTPCVRLPCDRQCDQVLSCGHRCPSLCGEICPAPAIACRHCASPEQQQMQVDMILFTSLKDHDPSEDPLIVLPCKHVFAMSTLDGIVELCSVYKKSSDGSSWTGLSLLPEECPKKIQCPLCRMPIYDVRRYGRILNWISIMRSAIKFGLNVKNDSINIQNDLIKLDSRLSELLQAVSAEKKCQMIPLKKEFKKIKENCLRLQDRVNQESPFYRVWEQTIAALRMKLDSYCHAIGDSSNDLNNDHNLNDNLSQKSKYVSKSFTAKIDSSLAMGHVLIREQTIECLNQIFSFMNQSKASQSNAKCRRPDIGVALKKMKAKEDAALKNFKEAYEMCLESMSVKTALKALEGHCLVMYQSVNNIHSIRKYVKWLPIPEEAYQMQLNAQKVLKDILFMIKQTSGSNNTESMITQIQIMESHVDQMCIPEKFYQEISREEKMMIFQVMGKDVGTGVGSFGGHWFTCRNGHVYTIGECGGAMEMSICPECGVEVGGTNHQRVSGSIVATEFLQDVGGQI